MRMVTPWCGCWRPDTGADIVIRVLTSRHGCLLSDTGVRHNAGDISVLCAAEGGLKGAHAEEWVSLGALRAISMALEVRTVVRYSWSNSQTLLSVFRVFSFRFSSFISQFSIHFCILLSRFSYSLFHLLSFRLSIFTFYSGTCSVP